MLRTLTARPHPRWHPASLRTRPFHTTWTLRNRDTPTTLTNILAGEVPPPVQVSSVTRLGIQLADGLVIPSACIFLEGKVFLWDVPPPSLWTKDHFEVFDVVVPKPEILLLGTGNKIEMPPSLVRTHLNAMGIQLDIMDTRNACATYNLLAEEGRRVAAALLPFHHHRPWQRLDN